MVAATSQEKSLFEQIEELRVEAESHQADAHSKMSEVKEAMERRNEALAKMGELVAEATTKEIQFDSSAIASTSVSGPTPKRRPAPTAGATSPAPKHRGRPKGSTNAAKKPAPAPAHAPAASSQNSDEITLVETIWDILDRENLDYLKYVTDYPEGSVGLMVSELKEVIEAEQKWHSKSDNIAPQIQIQVGILRTEGKLARTEDRRYYAVEGAELYGPPLDPTGKVRKAGPEEGTFLADDGKSVFTWTDGKPYKLRRKAAND